MKQHPNKKRVLRRTRNTVRREFYRQRAKTYVDLSINFDPDLMQKIKNFIDSIR